MKIALNKVAGGEGKVFFTKKQNITASDNVKHKSQKAVFWGASDRMVCCDGIDCEVNEFNVTSNSGFQDGGYVGTLEIIAPDQEQGLYIHAFFSGHWSFAVSPSNEEYDELPDWPIEREWGKTNAHSETLTIYCPEGSRVEVIERIAANS